MGPRHCPMTINIFTASHSLQQQTSSISNSDTNNRLNIQKKKESTNDRFTEESSTGAQMESKYFGGKSSESQAPSRTNSFADSWKKFLMASVRGGSAQTSNKVKTSGTQTFQMPVPNCRREEVDAFAELDLPSPDLTTAKLVPTSEKDWNSRKGQQPPPVSGTTLAAESFRKVLDSGFPPSRSIPVRKPFVNRRDFNKNIGRRVDHAQLPELRFILGDDLRVHKERNDELVAKQKPVSRATASNTIQEGTKSVSVEYVPPGISLFHVREAISIYGEIVGSFFKTGENGMTTCHIEFKSVEAKERALAARWIYVNGKQLSICRVDFPVTTIVRITNLSPETNANTVHSICMSYGNVESLQMTKDGAMDVCFSVSESPNMPKILGKLNEVTLNDRRWIAQPAPRLPKDLAKRLEGQKWVGLQLSNHIGNIKRQLQMKRIYLEDMEELHNAVMHMKESPNSGSHQSYATT
eukprot:Gb_12746 [translate_table: standard]